ncbi:hypothetical protein EHS25_005775 [Saitozyma podzolica]|uniref:Uncharacterized protein n=1 Tax=Saitozyma podzolica TaxID=1890683 RepID=A0A427XWG7_9TREE|nr:hypothetical protein EHS25_005775 [Saitozyma podzolica]
MWRDGYQFGLDGGSVANPGIIKQFGYNSNHVSLWGGFFSILGQQTAGLSSNPFGWKLIFIAVSFITTGGIIIEIFTTTWQH